MMPTLNNLHILVTRPSPAGEELCQFLMEQGAKATHLPTIDFAPPPDAVAFQEAIQQLGEQDWLIFISPHAVTSSVPDIRKTWPILPPHVKFATIGEGTARALRAAGYIPAVYPDENFSSEGLLALPEFQQLSGKSVAIVRGVGGRELLEKTLTQRGAHVLSVVAYQRILPTIDTKSYIDLLKQNAINVIICTSFEAVANLKQLLRDENWQAVNRIPLIVISERIKTLAENLGFQTIWVACNAKHQSILDVLVQRRNEL